MWHHCLHYWLWLEGILLRLVLNNEINFIPIRLCFINVYTYPNPTPYRNEKNSNYRCTVSRLLRCINVLKPSCAIHIPSILNPDNKRIGSKSARRETGQKSSDSDHWPVNTWISGNNTLADRRLIIWYFSRKRFAQKKFKHFQGPVSMYVDFQKLSRALKFFFFQIHKLSRVSRTRGNPVWCTKCSIFSWVHNGSHSDQWIQM